MEFSIRGRKGLPLFHNFFLKKKHCFQKNIKRCSKASNSSRKNIRIWISLSILNLDGLCSATVGPVSPIQPCSAPFSQVWPRSASFTPIGHVHFRRRCSLTSAPFTPVGHVHCCRSRLPLLASITSVGLVHSRWPHSISLATFTLVIGPVWPHSAPFRNKSIGSIGPDQLFTNSLCRIQ